MIGGRAFSSSIQRCGGSWKYLACQKPWSYSLSSSTRAMSSLKSPFEQVQPQKPQPFNKGSIIIPNRGFQTGGKQATSSLSAKLFAAFGVFFGIGSGAAYNAMNGENSNFAVFAAADKCGCDDGKKKDDCIEKKCDSAPCLRAMDCKEELIRKANCDLEKALKDVKGKAVEYTEAAMKAYCEAIALMCEYQNHAYCVIDNDELQTPAYEESWCCVYDIAKKRCEKVRKALEKGQCAWELLCRLREIIEAGKACEYTSCNPLLVTAEEALICAETELLNLKAKMDCVASEHDMVEQYKSVIESFRSELKSDVETLVAGMECCDIKFAEQETALMITLAYGRVVRVQKEMAQALVCQGRVPDRLADTCC